MGMTQVTLSRRVYQRTGPLFVAAFVTALLIVHFTVEWEPLEYARGQALQWTNIVSTFVWGYSIVHLLIGRFRAATNPKEIPRRRYEGILIVSMTVLFLALMLLDPVKLEEGEIYQFIYLTISLRILMGMESVALTHSVYNRWRRLFTSPLNIEMIIYFTVAFVLALRAIGPVSAFAPWMMDMGNWILDVPYKSVMRGIVIISAVGILFVVGRTLVGRESGMIEEETI
jgi:hypothetical protein